MIAVDTPSTVEDRISAVRDELRDALSTFRLDDAELAYAELTDQLGVDPDSDDMLAPRVMLGIFNGRLNDMLQMLNGLGEDRGLGLKAVCLHMMGDPTWEGLAAQVEETSASDVERGAMQSLLEARAA